jgi:SAM-dependent methyltransferase
MDEKVYHDMVKQQKEHWWFKARREIISKIISKYISSNKSTILEVGCGTGGNLLLLGKHGDVFAMEMDKFALEYAKGATGIDVREGWLPDNIPYNEKFDLICMFDVLEHIQDDKKALLEIKKLLNPSGIFIITVPAYSWLYGTHDKIHHHYRRYSSKTLREAIGCSEMKVLKLSYFNTLLFPLVIIARLFDMLNNSKESFGYSTPNIITNKLLYRIFCLEKYSITKINAPFGSSVFAVCRNI